jgi:putative two-component system response regulator
MRVIRMDKNGKILIVDDAKSNREILSEILNQYTVIEAKDGYEALEYLKSDSKSVALVLLDLVMPEMDGFEVLKYMNQNHLIEEVPVMIISIDKDDKSIEKAYELADKILQEDSSNHDSREQLKKAILAGYNLHHEDFDD